MYFFAVEHLLIIVCFLIIVFTVLFPPIILTVYEYLGSFYVNNINRKRWFSSPSSGKHFRVREMFLVSILSVWGENNPIKVSLWLALWRTVYIFFSFLFYLFVAFFSCCNFCFGSACHGRGRGENLSGGPGGGVVVFGFAVTCGSVVDRVRCALECSEPYRLSVAESY